MSCPGCPSCGRALVAVGLLAGREIGYTCSVCRVWYDSSLRPIAAPL
ncbi:MAG: hypothetical protein ABSA81_08590 [Candidatus Bathyarchaeia archaeon]